MVISNDQLVVEKNGLQSGLLGERVEREMEGVLDEYGSPNAAEAAERKAEIPVGNFAYGIPMAGVRYYMFTA